MAIEDVEDVVANVGQLRLDLDAIFLTKCETDTKASTIKEKNLDLCHVAFVALGLLLLLDGGDNAPGCAAGADDVLVRNRQQVSLLNGELDIKPGDGLHGLYHLVVPLRLLGDFGHVHILLSAFVDHL